MARFRSSKRTLQTAHSWWESGRPSPTSRSSAISISPRKRQGLTSPALFRVCMPGPNASPHSPGGDIPTNCCQPSQLIALLCIVIRESDGFTKLKEDAGKKRALAYLFKYDARADLGNERVITLLEDKDYV